MKPEILVVDDELYTREALVTLLGIYGYNVRQASNGQDALEKIEQCPPHLIILDAAMPEMDGITLCRKLRALPQTAHLPIILLSGEGHSHAEDEGLAAGADFYMWKPAKTPDLLARIDASLVRIGL